MDFKHGYFSGLVVLLPGPIVIGASKTVTGRDARRKEASKRAGSYVSISSALEIGLSFTDDSVMKIIAVILLLRRLFSHNFRELR